MIEMETIKFEEGKLNLFLMTGTFCAPCRFVKPVFQKFIDENKDENVNPVIFDVLEIDSNFVREYDVLNVPTLLIFKGDKLVGREMETTNLSNIEYYKTIK